MIIAKGSSFDGNSDGTSDLFADVAHNICTEYAASGAIAEKNALVILTASSALAMTLALPTAGAPGTGDDGKKLRILSKTAYAHTITCTSGYNGGGTSLITFAAAAGSSVTLTAYNGYWWIGDASITAAFASAPSAAYTTATAITQKTGQVMLTGTAARAMTLALPTAGTDDGKELVVMAGTAFAHTLTVAAAFRGTLTVATFAAVSDNVVLRAYNGAWYLQSYLGVTLS